VRTRAGDIDIEASAVEVRAVPDRFFSARRSPEVGTEGYSPAVLAKGFARRARRRRSLRQRDMRELAESKSVHHLQRLSERVGKVGGVADEDVEKVSLSVGWKGTTGSRRGERSP